MRVPFLGLFVFWGVGCVCRWAAIAQQLPGRIAKQCRERWHNHLNPDICKVGVSPTPLPYPSSPEHLQGRCLAYPSSPRLPTPLPRAAGPLHCGRGPPNFGRAREVRVAVGRDRQAPAWPLRQRHQEPVRASPRKRLFSSLHGFKKNRYCQSVSRF